MPYASDRLYNDYLRPRMAVFVTTVRVREILPHLPCLTQSDREEIEAKRETTGNYNAMQLLLDCLKRRDSWPDVFIAALESCEHGVLASEMRAKYNSFLTPPVVRAHVSPPPSANPSLPVPESAGDTPAAAAPTAQAAVPPAPAAQASPGPSRPVMPAAPPSPTPQATMATERAQVPQPPATPDIAPPRSLSPPPAMAPQEVSGEEIPIPDNAVAPGSPVWGVGSGIASVPEPAVPRTEGPASTQATLFQAAGVDVGPSQSAAPVETGPSSITESPPAPAVTESPPAPAVTESPPAPAVTESPPAPAVTETPVAAEATPALAATETPPAPASATESTPAPAAPALVQTPEKRPVQDTTPPEHTVIPAPRQPVENSESDELAALPPGVPTQRTAETTVAHSPPGDSVDGANSTLGDGEGDYFSKPGVLEDDVFSGNISLQISMNVPGPEQAVLAPVTAACSAVAPEPLTVGNPSPCQENGVGEEPPSLSNNEPEENLFESTCQSSLGDQEVLTNVVHVSEEPSVQNHDGQAPCMLGNAVSESEDPPVQNNDSQSQIILSGAVPVSDQIAESSLGNAACFLQDSPSQILNGQATKEPTSAPPIVTISVIGASSNENSQNSDLTEDEATLDLKPEGQEDPRENAALPPKNPKNYMLLTAAAVGVSALFVAWKLKH